MYPNFNFGNVPTGSGAGYPYMQQQPLIPPPLLPMQAPIAPPMVPPAFSDEYAKWAQWNSHFGAIAPTSSWRNQAAAAMPRTPYDHPVTAQHQVPYGGRPYVPRDLSGPNANTMRAPPVPATINQQKVPEPFYNNVTPTLDFDVHVSSTKLDIHWKAPHVSGQIVYELTVTEARSMPFTLEFPANHTKHTMRAKAGESYVIAITARKTANNVVVAQGQRQIKAIFSDAELRTLYDKAVKYTGSRMHPFEILYRCKPKPYWDDIHHNCNNVMEKYMKDDNGQPANMINGVISGLFFSARLLPNGTLPYSSPFGNVRMLVPAVRMLDPNGVNIYFADFYCNKQAHYVTIIVAKKGSESDVYSQKYLLPLDMRSNPWLKYRLGLDAKGMSKLLFEAAHSVWVEVLFTEHVPLSWGRFDKIQATGLGTSKIGGLSNNKSCTICNLYPPGASAGPAREDRERHESERDREERHKRDKERRRDREEEEKDGERRKKRRRSVSPVRVVEEEEENVEPPEFEPLNEDDDDLDGVPLPAYEMGGNSTFQTLINLGNANDYPGWTDLIECVCEMVDAVVGEEQRQITNFKSACDSRVAAAIEEMDSVVGMCDDDKIHDLAAEVHELAGMWQRARDELAKLAEAREDRDARARARRVTPTPPPPAAAAAAAPVQKRPSVEEDLDEYLDDDVTVLSSSTAPATPKPLNLTPSAMAVAAPAKTPAPAPAPIPPARSASLAQSSPNWMMAKVFPQQPLPTTVTSPSTTVAGEQTGRNKRKERRKTSKAKEEEELDEYLDDEPSTVSTSREQRRDTVEVVKKEAAVPVTQEAKSRRDVLDDSALDLSLFDEVNATILAPPTPAAKNGSTVAAAGAARGHQRPAKVEEEDEYLEEEEDTVDVTLSTTDPVGGPPKKIAIDVIDLTEEELLGSGLGSGPLVDITPEMEEELLRG